MRAAVCTFLAMITVGTAAGTLPVHAQEGHPVQTATAYSVFDVWRKASIDISKLVDRAKDCDVVLVGENHNNAVAHLFEIELIRALHAAGCELVISMEMFDRDKQGVINDYLADRIDEALFVKQSRVWPNYEKSYRSVIEFAKENNVDVIAANLPRAMALRVARGQSIPKHQEVYAARSTSAAKDRYWLMFSEKVSSADQNKNSASSNGRHGASNETVAQFFRAQCLKDDTMAESIVTYRQMHFHRRPLIVHLSGNLHVEHGLGLPARILSRAPLLRLCAITMEQHPDGTRPTYAEQSHFLVHLH